jgi:hypothetical protein
MGLRAEILWLSFILIASAYCRPTTELHPAASPTAALELSVGDVLRVMTYANAPRLGYSCVELLTYMIPESLPASNQDFSECTIRHPYERQWLQFTPADSRGVRQLKQVNVVVFYRDQIQDVNDECILEYEAGRLFPADSNPRPQEGDHVWRGFCAIVPTPPGARLGSDVQALAPVPPGSELRGALPGSSPPIEDDVPCWTLVRFYLYAQPPVTVRCNLR